MKASTLAIGALACLLSAGCDRGYTNANAGVEQTKFPGQVTAGGLTSGQVMARSAKPETNAAYSGGTPGIAGGSGGNTGGAALGGTVTESGQGPNQGASTPAGAKQEAGNRPTGDYGGPPANAPAAGVTAVGAGTATNQQGAGPATNNAATGQPAGGAPAAGAPAQPAKPPAAPGTLTGDK